MKRLLLVEDDENLGVSLKKFLEKEGFAVTHAQSLDVASKELNERINLVILDWMLPDGQGIDFLRKIRAEGILTPVIMLTARNELIDKVLGLETGANDYMTKPFEPRELVARLRVQLRTKKQPIVEQKIRGKDLEIDLSTRDVLYEGNPVVLTKMEFDLLALLAGNPGRAYSRDELLNKVWGFENYPSTRTVDTHILQLRQKFSDQMFETVRSVGYRFNKIFSHAADD